MYKFKVSSYKEKKYHWVIIHDTIDEFKKAAREYFKSGTYRYVGEYGLYHPYEKWNSIKKSNDIGIIRLSADKLYPRCVYHETIHAALWQYRLKHRKKADFGSHIDKREEEFAHIYNQLVSKIVTKLYKLELW